MIASTLASPRRKAINSLRLLYKLHNGNTISSIKMLLMIQTTSISNALGSMSLRPPSPSGDVVGRIDRAMEGLDSKLASMRRSRGFALSVSFLRSATQQRSLIALSPRALSLLLRLSASVLPSRFSSFSRCGSSRSCLRNDILMRLSLMLLETAGWTRFGLFLIDMPTSMLLIPANSHHSIGHLAMAIINASSSFLIEVPTSMLLIPANSHHSIMHQAMANINASSS